MKRSQALGVEVVLCGISQRQAPPVGAAGAEFRGAQGQGRLPSWAVEAADAGGPSTKLRFDELRERKRREKAATKKQEW